MTQKKDSGGISGTPETPPVVTAEQPTGLVTDGAAELAERRARAMTVTPDRASDPEGYKAYVARLRDQRKPFAGFTQKLAYPPRAGYYRYWFNDEPGRIVQARDAGYEHVKNPQSKQPEKRVVGVRKEGGALFAYLMEIPTEIWEDDQKLTRRRTDDMEQAIRQSRVIAQSDQSAKEDEGNFYVPGGGSKVEGGQGRKRL